VKTKTNRLIILVAVALVVIVGTITGIAIYRDRVAPFKITVVAVDDATINMGYFLKRVALSGGDPMLVLQRLAEEELLRQVATEPPYSITVSEDDMDILARDLARGENETIDEMEFREWYRQELNETGLSDSEYRELLTSVVLERRMSDYLGERVPTVAEQVLVHMIPVEDRSTGDRVKAEHDAGEEFATLARVYSVSPTVAEKGGELGWFPRGVLDSQTDRVAFGLETGEGSEPFYSGEQIVVLMVSDRVAARQIEDQSLQILRSRALQKWYAEVSSSHEVKYYGFEKGYDSETNAWVLWQLQRMQRGERNSE